MKLKAFFLDFGPHFTSTDFTLKVVFLCEQIGVVLYDTFPFFYWKPFHKLVMDGLSIPRSYTKKNNVQKMMADIFNTLTLKYRKSRAKLNNQKVGKNVYLYYEV